MMSKQNGKLQINKEVIKAFKEIGKVADKKETIEANKKLKLLTMRSKFRGKLKANSFNGIQFACSCGSKQAFVIPVGRKFVFRCCKCNKLAAGGFYAV